MKTGNLFLIVDDDPDDQELFIQALQAIDKSCQCITAFNGREAMQKILNEMILIPDFIFSDLNMPIMNGKEFLNEIKNIEELSHIPFIMYSTSYEKRDIDETTAMGASYYFQKPNKFDDLSKALTDIISGNFK